MSEYSMCTDIKINNVYRDTIADISGEKMFCNGDSQSHYFQVNITRFSDDCYHAFAIQATANDDIRSPIFIHNSFSQEDIIHAIEEWVHYLQRRGYPTLSGNSGSISLEQLRQFYTAFDNTLDAHYRRDNDLGRKFV